MHARFEPERRKIFELPPEPRRPRPVQRRSSALSHAPQKLPSSCAVARSWEADAIVCDSGDLAAPIVAAALGIPSVNHSFGAMIPLAALERAEDVVAPLWEGRAGARRRMRAPSRGLYVDIAPTSFAWEQPLGASCACGRFPTLAATSPAWLDELGAAARLRDAGHRLQPARALPPLLGGLDGDVLGARDRRRAASTRRRSARCSPRVRLERFVPQADVLPALPRPSSRHGGSGTTLGALAHGLPLVLVPQAADQFDNAARCVAAGVAVVIGPDELSADPSRAAAAGARRAVVHRRGARGSRLEIEEMGTPDEVATAVEEHVARG